MYSNKDKSIRDNLRQFPYHIDSLNLQTNFKLTRIKCKSYKSYGQLHYFALELPSKRFVAAKFASEDRQQVDQLHRRLRKAIDKIQWAPRNHPTGASSATKPHVAASPSKQTRPFDQERSGARS